MPAGSFTLVACVAAAATAAVALREHQRLRGARRHILEGCRGVLTDARIAHGSDGFPQLDGVYKGHRIRAELIPDTMTIRRLPQLWLSVTLLARLPVEASFAVLVRPSGADFYSLTESLSHGLASPAGFPWEVLIRGSDPRASALFEQLSAPLAALLSDPRVKEIAVTAKGLRIVRQAGEGRRGEHLLLRQAMFDNADVSAADASALLSGLERLHEEILTRAKKPIAA